MDSPLDSREFYTHLMVTLHCICANSMVFHGIPCDPVGVHVFYMVNSLFAFILNTLLLFLF